MKDDLLRALARTQRDDQGTGTPMQDVKATSGQTPAPDRFAPLEPAERDALLDAVFARVDARTPAGSVPPVVGAQRPRRATAIAMALIVAVAAMAVLWLARPGTGGATLPSYALTELSGGASAVRAEPGAHDGELELLASDRIELTVTPAQAGPAALVVDLVAQAPGRPDVMARVPAEISASGAVRLEGPLDRFIALTPGSWQIWVVISPAADAPSGAQAALAAEHVRRVGFRVRLFDPG